MEFYPEHVELEYRLAGLYFQLNQEEKGVVHLMNGLNSEPEYTIILEELFPAVFTMKRVKEIINKHKNPSI